MKRIMFFIISIVFLNTFLTFAQRPPCRENHTLLSFYTVPILKHPELRTDMSLEVINAYILYDSLRKLGSYVYRDYVYSLGFGSRYYSFLSNYYILDDYDALLFYKNSAYQDSNYIYSNFRLEIDRYIDEKSPYKLIESSIFGSSYILHIKAIDTIRRYSDYDENYGGIVTARILDKLKGNVMPSSKNIELPASSTEFVYQKPESTIVKKGEIIQFDYIFSWWNGPNYLFIKSDGSQWIDKDKEYIVFLRYEGICLLEDKSKRFYSLRPWNLDSKYFLMYEIKDGILLDDYDEFGFGKNITVEEWKAKFRKLVKSYLDGNPLTADADNFTEFLNNSSIIHPNPATDYIYINFNDLERDDSPSNNSGSGSVKIYNTLGQCVSHLTPTLSKGEGVRIDVSQLPVGVYLVRVGNKVEKFVKW